MDHQGSELHDAESWPAWDVAALLDRDVPPGESGYLMWTIRAPDEQGEATEKFRLARPDGTPVRCPSPTVDVSVLVRTAQPATSDQPADTAEGCGCRLARSPRPGPWLAPLALAGALLRLSVRRRPAVDRVPGGQRRPR
jgi:MYXO-CTERM domain-containing protein